MKINHHCSFCLHHGDTQSPCLPQACLLFLLKKTAYRNEVTEEGWVERGQGEVGGEEVVGAVVGM